MEERARISLIQFMIGKKITLDESKFEIKTAGDDIVVTLKNNPSITFSFSNGLLLSMIGISFLKI